ncbi:Uncharacterised protein [Klebsiella pneumoniae]|nr:Uncharacterised protein [Klebsiella pneumoniae]SWO30494.1 Uncharacterised protein [Klebsiella pneumoniae]SYR43626.1 Uncharacterised protein [Klebsiella pneumoniae]
MVYHVNRFIVNVVKRLTHESDHGMNIMNTVRLKSYYAMLER